MIFAFITGMIVSSLGSIYIHYVNEYHQLFILASFFLFRFMRFSADIKFDFGFGYVAFLDSGGLNRRDGTSLSILITPF